MSLDLYLCSIPCEMCGHEPESIEFNITYNLSKMWYYLHPDDNKMLPIETLIGKESVPIINKALNEFIKNKKDLIKFNPPNCWGTYEGFVEEFRKMRNACEDYPDYVWGAFR